MASESKELAQPSYPAAAAGTPAALRPWIGWLAAIAWAEVLLIGAHRVAPAVELSPVLAYAVGFCAVVGTSLACAARCPLAGPRLLGLLALPGAGALLLSLRAPA